MAGEEKFGYFRLSEGTEGEDGSLSSGSSWLGVLYEWRWKLTTDCFSFVYGLWVRSSTASFNKCIFVNSTWHCASFTKQNTLNNSQTWSGMPLKINYPLIPYTGNLLIYKGVNELLKPNANQIKSKWTYFHSICLIDDRLKCVDFERMRIWKWFGYSHMNSQMSLMLFFVVFFIRYFSNHRKL